MPNRHLFLDESIWVLVADIGVPAYDFQFEQFFPARQPWDRPGIVDTVARIGAFTDYAESYGALLKVGIRLVHSPEQYERCTSLPRWYPILKELTPRSVWFEDPPSARDVGDCFGWPVFVKGSRQTGQHSRKLSIIEGPKKFDQAMKVFRDSDLLSWQKIVCREFVPLRRVEHDWTERIPPSFEFRTFWWKGSLVGAGRYWVEARPYHWNDRERTEALAVAKKAADRLDVTFPVIDVAQTQDGSWIVIECNDGQESGYTGVSPIGLWQSVVAAERPKHDDR